jgi:hypothetical protein
VRERKSGYTRQELSHKGIGWQRRKWSDLFSFAATEGETFSLVERSNLRPFVTILADDIGSAEQRWGLQRFDRILDGFCWGWAIKEVKLGGELYGGLGDSTLGLTLDPNLTQQYAGLNLKTEWANGLHVMAGGAAGLTKESERGLLRLMLGYEFE